MDKSVFDGLFFTYGGALIKQMSLIDTKLNKPDHLIKSTQENFESIGKACKEFTDILIVRTRDVTEKEDKVLLRRAIKSSDSMKRLANGVAKKIDKEKIKETAENRKALKKSTLMSLFYYVLELVKASKGLKVGLYRQLEINLQGFQKKTDIKQK